jgi:sugar/nucleoside kinase (ribokinase family)
MDETKQDPERSPAGAIACLGETIVDLIADAPLRGAGGTSYRPFIGGAPTNVAVAARRCGAPVLLAGGAGDDALGRWLLERLTEEGLDLRSWSLHAEAATPIALVSLDACGVPDFSIHAAGLARILTDLRPRIEAIVAAAGALVLGSNTLVGETEREVTLEAVMHARRHATPILFDPNLRVHRWQDPGQAVDLVRGICAHTLLTKVSADEAVLIAGRIPGKPSTSCAASARTPC